MYLKILVEQAFKSTHSDADNLTACT